jgi:signal transduction histidine kinase
VLLTLCLLGWAGYQHIDRPTLGLYWNYASGFIYQVDDRNPSVAQVQVGDRLLSGNSLEPKHVYALIDQGEVDTILLQLERAGSVYAIRAEAIKPDLMIVISRVSFIIIALCFWLTGTLIFIFGQDRKQSVLFLFFCIFTSITLAAGSISSFGPYWTKILLYFGIVWCGFFAVHLHLDFPSRINFSYRRFLLVFLAIVNGAISISFCLEDLYPSIGTSQQGLWPIALIIFSLEMLAVIGSVGKSFLHASSACERYRAGIIVLATILGTTPVLIFSVLPELLIGRTIFPYEFSFLSLLAFPFGYGYGIFRYKLLHFDSTVDRGAALAFVVLILGGFYAIVFLFLASLLPGAFDETPMVGMGITILMTIISRNLGRRMVFWINRVLYGEWYDYRSAVNMINDHLKSAETEYQAITSTFCQVIMKSLQLSFVAAITHDRWLTLVEVNTDLHAMPIPEHKFESIWRMITASDPSQTFQSRSNQKLLAPILSDRLMARIQMIMPIRNQEQIIGLLILGRKRGGGILGKSDLEVLDVAIHQAQISMEKARLLVDVRKYNKDIRELHRKLTQTREAERKQVARELHDEVIQSLVSLNYQLSEMRRRTIFIRDEDIQSVQNDVVSVIGDVRQICADLRPPVLDSLDLPSVFRSKIDEYLRQASFHIRFFAHGEQDREIPEPVGMFAYRLLLEGLTNINKHANARSVEVHLSINSDELIVIVQDDGAGFLVPARLNFLEATQHFGLVSLIEDAQALNGSLEIDSSIGEGCCLVATIPLISAETE